MTFKIGDRIRAYTASAVIVGKIERFTESGDIEAICKFQNDNEIMTLFFHPKQCRKLKPKQRREWWINLQEIDTGSFKMAAGEHFLKSWFNNPYGEFIRTTPPPNKEGWIKVWEVKE